MQRKPSCATTKSTLFAISKDNGTQRRTLVSPRRMHCTYSVCQKAHLALKIRQTLIEIIKLIVLAVIELCYACLKASGSQVVSRKVFKNSVTIFLKECQVDLKACLDSGYRI